MVSHSSPWKGHFDEANQGDKHTSTSLVNWMVDVISWCENVLGNYLIFCLGGTEGYTHTKNVIVITETDKAYRVALVILPGTE